MLFTPAEDYAGLLDQAQRLAKELEHERTLRRHWQEQCAQQTRKWLESSRQAIDSERAVNDMLSQTIEALDAEISRLTEQSGN